MTFASAGTNGMWLGIVEKAAGRALNKENLIFHSRSSVDELDGNRFLNAGIKLMTNNEDDADFIAVTNTSTIRRKLIAAFATKAVVVAIIFGDLSGTTTSDGLPVAHVYAVLGYDQASDTLTIRNPWGTSATPFSGTFTLTMDKFVDNFSEIAFEEIP